MPTAFPKVLPALQSPTALQLLEPLVQSGSQLKGLVLGYLLWKSSFFAQ